MPDLRRAAFATALALGALAAPNVASADVTTEIRNNTLFIESDADPDRIRLGDSGGDGIAVLVNEITSKTFARSDFSRVQVIGGDGADQVAVRADATFTDTDPLTANLGAGADTFDGGDGEETALGEAGDDTLTGAGADDTLIGGGDNDRIRGDKGLDLLTGGPGDDVFTYARADSKDEIRGGDGDDRLDVVGNAERDEALLTLHEGVPRMLVSKPVAGDVHAEVETIAFDGGDGADQIIAPDDFPVRLVLRGDAGLDRLSGGGLDDVIEGGEGPDTVRGGAGADRVRGGGDRDFVIGDAGPDELTGGAGDDEFRCDDADTIFDFEPGDGAGGCDPLLQAPRPPAPEPVAPAPPAAPSPAPVEPVAPVPPGGGVPANDLPRGALGFAKPRIAFARTGLKVVLRNTDAAPIRVALAATEKRGRAKHRYARITKTIAAGRRVTVTLKAPRALRRQLKAKAAGRRRASVTVTNLATGGKLTVRR